MMLPVKEHSDEGRISVNSMNSANSRKEISAVPAAEHYHGTQSPGPCFPGAEQSNGQGPVAFVEFNGMPNGRAQLPPEQRMPVSAFAARAGMPDASLSAKQMEMSLAGPQSAGAVPSIRAL